jgi:hypothetical protein
MRAQLASTRDDGEPKERPLAVDRLYDCIFEDMQKVMSGEGKTSRELVR